MEGEKHRQCTLSKEEENRLDGPKASRKALPVRGNLSLAFKSISLISPGSFIDTRSWVGPNHSFTTDPYLLCDSDKRSENKIDDKAVQYTLAI